MAAMGMAAAIAAGGAIGIIAYQTSCGWEHPNSRPVAVPVKKSLALKKQRQTTCGMFVVYPWFLLTKTRTVLFLDVVSIFICLPKRELSSDQKLCLFAVYRGLYYPVPEGLPSGKLT